MTDSRKDSQKAVRPAEVSKQALVMIDDVPHFELAAGEIVYPLEIGNRGAHVHVHLSPYRPQELKDVLAEAQPYAKLEGRSRLITEPGDRSAYRPFAQKHFIGLSKLAIKRANGEIVDATPEQAADLWRKNPQLQERAVLEGFGGMALDETLSELEDESGGFVLTELSEAVRIPVTQDLADPNGKIVTFRGVFVNEKETQGQRQRYDKATKSEMHTAKRELRAETDYSAMEQLFGQVAQGAERFLVNGERCTAANREIWIPFVHLYWKKLAMDAQFDRFGLKN